ncbi:hypothetical protein K469DRAFT_706367 [Zopfia rhizophila CBS 207.26]|uniref:BZIP domain-containing protein n=1 Tax=Zopfia rhizophila CBS 207.26 TaxID=1314779 RepID=A0A6A6EVT3_9PEZI|nr:hypothetical protein K469DRAFT_706367 [Zopfia rhizophila CBS 207.26]
MTPSFNNQCMDPDTDAFFDFSQLPSPTPSSASRQPSNAASAITSPTNTVLDGEDLQTPAKPSHEYERFKQQTGLPSGSIAGINQPMNGGYQMFSSTGLDEMSLMGGSSVLDAGWNSGLGIGSDVNMELDLSLSQPAYFYPSNDASQSDDFVDPSAITQEEVTNVRVWPGMHQQQAALAKAQAQAQQQRQQQLAQQKQAQQQQQSRLHPNRRAGSSQITDARTEETITRVVNQIRQNSQNGTLSSQNEASSQGLLPHIVRMKKDEEDMDEDERLLTSEEGKKLSSKERRQLRNKVSARAFRSRRKEYIGQLEGEVAMKTNECNELRAQNRALMEENARSRAFIERLLRHQAFTPFLEELSRDDSLEAKPAMSLSSAPTPTPAPARKDVNPYQSQQFGNMSQPENPQIGMALIPETQLDLSMLNLNTNNWGMTNMNSFNFQQPQVYAVLELPEGPSTPIDTEALSGKGHESFLSEEASPIEEVKPDFPIIERPVKSEEPTLVQVEEDDDPEFDLYRSSPAPSTSAPTATPLENHESLFGDADPEKVFAHFELFISDEAENQRLMERFERMCAAIEPVYQRIQAMTSHLDS